MLKTFEICEKIIHFTVISDVCHQNIEGENRNVCDLVLIFSQNQRLFFLEVKLYRSPSFNKCYGLYCDKTRLF